MFGDIYYSLNYSYSKIFSTVKTVLKNNSHKNKDFLIA